MDKPTTVPSATTPANTGSNKSTPMLTIATPKNVTKWVLLIVVAFAVIVGITLLVASVKRDRAEKVQKSAQALSQQTATIPLASSPQSSWPKLVIPAGGKSENIVVPAGMHITLIGDGFVLHSIYVDGHECTSKEICPNGYITETFITNEAPTTNTIAYAFTQN